VRSYLLPLAAIVAAVFVTAATIRDARTTALERAARPGAERGGGLPLPRSGTSRAELANTVGEMTARLRARADDAAAAVALAGALLRLQRVNNDGRAVITAEQHLREFLKRRPAHYDTRRLLAAVLLSQHRFGEAIAEAERTKAADPRDPWNYGVIGDGYVELGDYDRAFAAFDRMGQIAPGPPVYARTSYALEITGDLDGAIEYMRMAADGTSANDPESQAWHYAQLGDLLLQQGRLVPARIEYERAMATFPDHPLAILGLARVKIVEGDARAARLMLQKALARAPTPDLAILVGDLSERLGDRDGAAPYFRMAEQIERAAWDNGPRQPHVLARLFVDRDRHLGDAVALAEAAVRTRRDIFTCDTLAAAYLKVGRLEEARKYSDQALRTGTRDPRILWHAAEIRAAAGDRDGARALLARIPAVQTITDLQARDGVAALLAHLGRT
jgi:tetratricopeptide (TPR) repeat protein